MKEEYLLAAKIGEAAGFPVEIGEDEIRVHLAGSEAYGWRLGVSDPVHVQETSEKDGRER